MTRFKIDENLHPDVASFMREHGHDVLTVWDKGLRSARPPVSLMATTSITECKHYRAGNNSGRGRTN